jgi:uncharacterized protein (TIGR03435 family)
MRSRLAGALIVLSAPLWAQGFDAASIRLNPTWDFERGIIGVQPGRLRVVGASLGELAAAVSGLRADQIIGADGWMTSARYDIIATMPAGTTLPAARDMLRVLIEDRFALRSHREMRTLPVYTLRVARADGQVGPRLRRSRAECAPPVAPPGVPMPPAPPPSSGEPIRALSGAAPARCPTMFFSGMVSSRAAPLSSLVARLIELVRRPVIDETGLSGEFDVDLYYQAGVSSGGDTGLDGSAPALSAALQEQLGLKLESGRRPVEVLVIDAAAQPREQ